MTVSKSNPFKPGYGLPPPHLAGRGKEQKLFRRRLDAMVAGESVNGVTMLAPRGMGKTVLLDWLEEQCVERGVGYLAGNPADMLGSVDVLGNMLLSAIRPPEGWHIERASFGGMGLKIEASAPARGTGKEAQLSELLISHCREKPMVVLLDEAHAPSDSNALRLFLNMAQQVARKAPFLLVLAGTPRLTDTLRNAEVTFIERAKSIGLGCLDKESAAAALRVPLGKDGITITEDALEQVLEDSQCYPFFIQQWGEVLWDHAAEKRANELTQDDVKSVIADIQAERTGFYASRYSGIIETPELLVAVDALVQALLVEKRDIDEYSVIEIIKSSLSEAVPSGTDIETKAREIMRGLIRHDFFWCPPASDLVVPGIPSFMTYVRDRLKR